MQEQEQQVVGQTIAPDVVVFDTKCWFSQTCYEKPATHVKKNVLQEQQQQQQQQQQLFRFL
jgi:hypothetical protein